MAGTPSRRAAASQRNGPSAEAPGWLRVGNSGDRKARSAPSRRARADAAPPPWAAIVSTAQGAPARRASRKGSRPCEGRRSGRCSPAWAASAARPSPATSTVRPRRRAIRARRARTGAAVPRASTPAPRGSPRRHRAWVGQPHRVGDEPQRRQPPATPQWRHQAPRPRWQRGGIIHSMDSGPRRSALALPCHVLCHRYSRPAGGDPRQDRRGLPARQPRPGGGDARRRLQDPPAGGGASRPSPPGRCVFGENRVQEAEAKFPALRAAHPAMRLHIIGGVADQQGARRGGRGRRDRDASTGRSSPPPSPPPWRRKAAGPIAWCR